MVHRVRREKDEGGSRAQVGVGHARRSSLVVSRRADDCRCAGRLDLRPPRHAQLRQSFATLGLGPGALLLAILELWQNLFAEQLDRGAQHVVREVPGLRQADYLVDPGVLKLAQSRAQLLWRADAVLRAPIRRRELFGMILELVPDIGFGRFMLAEKAVVPQPIDEEAVALRGDLLHSRFVPVAQERAGDRDVRIHRVAQGHALLLEGLVIVDDPLASLPGIDESCLLYTSPSPRDRQ